MSLIWINETSIRQTFARLSLALMDGIVKADAEQGQVIVLELQENSICPIVGHTSLRRNRGEGGYVWRSQTVKESNSISLTLSDAIEYVDTKEFSSLPIKTILPVLAYLLLLEYGAQPTDEITWPGGKTSVEDLFLQEIYYPIEDATENFIPNGLNTFNAILSRLGFIPSGNPPTLDLLRDIKAYSFRILDWLGQLALGQGLSEVFGPESDNPGQPRKSIKKLQEILMRSGAQAMGKVDVDGDTPVSGYSYVSMPDNNDFRDIAFCGSFPADKPKYEIIVWLHQKEQSDELKEKECPELSVYAARVCKRVVDYFMNEAK